MKRLSGIIISLILVMTITGTCQAGWRDRMSSFGSRVQGATKRAIDWGAEKFRPAMDRIRGVSERGARANYERGLRIKEDPAGYVKDTVVNEAAGDIKSAREAAGHLAEGDLQNAANVGCKAVASPPVPLAGEAVSPYTNEICDEIFPPGDAEASSGVAKAHETCNAKIAELENNYNLQAANLKSEFQKGASAQAAGGTFVGWGMYEKILADLRAQTDMGIAQAKSERDAAIAATKD